MDDLIALLTRNQCDHCMARSLIVAMKEGTWHCNCWSCGSSSTGNTMDEAIQNWRDQRDLKKMDELRKKYEIVMVSK